MKPAYAFVVLAVLSSWILLVPVWAHAQSTYTVNSTLDQVDDNPGNGVCHTSAGACTLRAAIMESNHNTGQGGVTIIVPAGIYVLTIPNSGIYDPGSGRFDPDSEGDLNLTPQDIGSGRYPVTSIVGAGPALTIIDGNGIDGVIHVNADRSALISGVTIRNGKNTDLSTGNLGGGIRNAGTLTLRNVVVRNNEAGEGGGIYNSNVLDIYTSTIESNVATGGNGGGIENFGLLSILQSTIDANSAADEGGGIFIDDSADLTVISSTVSGNHAGNNGGGVYSSGSVRMYSSSIIANEADSDRSSSGTGGGIFTAVSPAYFDLHNVLAAGNYFAGHSAYNDCNGTVNIFDANVFFANTCATTGAGTLGTLNSLQWIGSLHDNGGPTFTHALLFGSNVIDPIVNGECVGPDGLPLAVDQRGQPRVFGARCDIGAVEYDDTIFSNGFE